MVVAVRARSPRPMPTGGALAPTERTAQAQMPDVTSLRDGGLWSSRRRDLFRGTRPMSRERAALQVAARPPVLLAIGLTLLALLAVLVTVVTRSGPRYVPAGDMGMIDLSGVRRLVGRFPSSGRSVATGGAIRDYCCSGSWRSRHVCSDKRRGSRRSEAPCSRALRSRGSWRGVRAWSPAVGLASRWWASPSCM
jgi:hypothetical protein